MEESAFKLPLEILLSIAELTPLRDLVHLLKAIPTVGKQLPTKQIQAQDENGDNILHFLAEIGYDDLILLYREALDPLHIANYAGMTPLHKAAANSNYGTVAVLLDLGSNISALDNRNESALHYSIHAGTSISQSIIRLLLSRNADVTLPNIGDFTPLHGAVISHQDPTIIQLLIDSGAHVNARAGRKRWTPIFYAARFSHETPGEVLASAGADLEGRMEQSQDHLFSRQRGIDILKVLLRAGADLTVRDKEDRTILMETARLGADDSVRLLLKAGANVDEVDGQSRTALFHAVMRGNRSTAKRLMEAGANIWGRDESGRSVVEIANWYGNDELAKMLQRAQRMRPWGYLREKAG